MLKRIRLLYFVYLLFFVSSYSNYKIAVVPKGSINQFWKSVKTGVYEAAEEYGANIIYRGPVIESKYELQIRIIEKFIRDKVDAIVLAPAHKDMLLPVIKKAHENGIKIVIIDSELSGNYHDAFIATDNYNAGRLAGEEFIKLHGKKKVGILKERKGNASTDQREQGFEDVLTENNIEIGVSVYGGTIFRNKLILFERILNDYPDIRGYFTSGELSTLALQRAIENLENKADYTVIGFDLNNDIEMGIKNNIINGVMIQQPKHLGYLGIKTALELLDGKEVQKEVLIDAEYFTD